MSGDLEGTYYSGSTVAFDETGLKFAISRTDVFRGTVAGCGSGTMVLVGNEVADPQSGTGEWTIAEGFGTGDLAHASGHGNGTGTADGTGIHSEFEGVIDCGT
jgi:hypothetical protein